MSKSIWLLRLIRTIVNQIVANGPPASLEGDRIYRIAYQIHELLIKENINEN